MTCVRSIPTYGVVLELLRSGSVFDHRRKTDSGMCITVRNHSTTNSNVSVVNVFL